MTEAITTQPTALTPIAQVKQSLEAMTERIQSMLPSHIKPEKFIRSALVAIQLNPYLLECDRNSLYLACLRSASIGLIPDGREAALVPFQGKIQFQPMVLGLCKLFINSGQGKMLDSIVVHENDQFESYTDENGPHFKHVRAHGERGKIICVFAYAITKDGGIYVEEMSAAEVEAIKKSVVERSKGKFTPWVGPYEEEMWRKTAIKRLAKYRIPASSELMDFEDEPANDEPTPVDPPQQPAKPVSSRLASVVAEAVKPATEGQPEGKKEASKAVVQPAEPQESLI